MAAFSIESGLRRRFEEYESYHLNFTNKSLHYVGIPLIMLGLLGLLARVSLWDRLDAGFLVWSVATVYYVWIARGLGLFFSGLIFWFYFFGRVFPMPIVVLFFVAGWVIQAVGHFRFERNSPAFIKNLEHLLIGPLWLFFDIFGGGKS